MTPEHRAPEKETEGGGSGEGEEEEGDARLGVPDLQVALLVPLDIVDDHGVGGDVQEHPVLPVHQAVHGQAAVVAKHPGQALQGRGSPWLSAARTNRAHEVCGVMEEGRAGAPGAVWAIPVALCPLYSQGDEGCCPCSSGTASPAWPPTPGWQSLCAVCASPCSLREGWRWLPWTQTVLGVLQGVQHLPGMMSQQCLPPGCPGSQPRCWAGCLRSPYLKEMTGDTAVALQCSLVLFPPPPQ